MKNLQDLRDNLTQIDTQLLSLLGERVALVKEVGEYKKKHNLPIVDEKREREILDRLATEGQQYDLSSKFIKKLWQVIFQESYTLEK